jgi:hypothetical protein
MANLLVGLLAVIKSKIFKTLEIMEVRIKFSADIYIKGENMAEVKSKFEQFPIFSADALEEGNVEYSETLLVEDAETYKDLMDEYNKV